MFITLKTSLRSAFKVINRLSPLRLSGVKNHVIHPVMAESEPVKKKGGRPPSPKKRDKKINLYVTGLEELAIKKRAERAGLNLSDFCRQIVLSGQAQVRLTAEENAKLNEAARLGNNLNQIAHKANADGIRSIAVEAQRLLKQLSLLLDKPTVE